MFLLNVENAKNRGLLERCTTFPKRMYHLDRIGDEIDSISARLAAVARSRETYGIRDLGELAESGWRSKVESLRRLSPWKKDEHLVGVEDDVKKLLQESILYKEKKGLLVAVLEGMGGIGKSTLARKIYNHPNVTGGPFECRAWIVVSSEFTPQETIKQLMFQLQMSQEDKHKLLDEIKKLEELTKDKPYIQDELMRMLHSRLDGKSYFIVLDDVWETQHLESLITAFPNQQDKASRILVTSRNKMTTKYDLYVHKMKLLDPDNGWELLLNKAFIDAKCPYELESIGRQILEKCHGLPLAISVVGGLLMEMQTKSGWEQVLKNINSYLGRSESSVFSILELSYQNLSFQLKSCFLCLSFFKEDFTIHAKRLVTIWYAQGLIQEEANRSIDEIGRGYLNELINRSMLQIEELTFGGDRVKNCRIHDLVREVCLRKAKEEIGLQLVKRGEEGISTQSSRKPRHRVVYGNNLKTCSSKQNKHIRSIFLLRDGDDLDFVAAPCGYWKSYHLLKTLELDGFRVKRLPNSFRLLIGLKCLRIHYVKYSEFSLDLPSWLDHLKNLEVLGMESCKVRFPRLVPLKMERLLYFYADIVRGPTQISSWKNIEYLKHIGHKDWLRCGSNLTSGCRLRELSISFDGRQIECEDELMKVKESLEKLQNLVILHLRGIEYLGARQWGPDPDLVSAIPNHVASLTKLKLEGRLPEWPDAQTEAESMFPPNLSYLTLDGCRLDDNPMAELGKLRKLSFLKLKYAFDGRTLLVLCNSFPSLEALMFVKLPNLKRIVIEEGGMPKLKHVSIHNCRKLDTSNLPEHINISRK